MNPALKRHPVVAFLAATTAILLAISAALLPGKPARAAQLAGTVLSSATATLPPELAPLANGKRISYLSTDVRSIPITATGLILTPKTGKNNKIVVWGHGTTGLADQCAPSVSQAVFWPEARAAIAELLRRGWTVAAPDYPGLGTALPHPYLVGASAARSMIDSAKAAKNLDATLGTQYAIDGHSQGGQGALFANELAPSYDGNLTLKGVAAIAPVSNADLFAPLIPGTPAQGYLVMALYGLQAVDPTVAPQLILAPPAQARTGVLQSGCLYEILDAYDDLTASELLVGGALPAPVVAKLSKYANPAQKAPSAPILLVQGTADEAVPYVITAGPLLTQLSAYRQPVEFIEIEGATHDGAVFESTVQVANWISGRFS
ncbi:alpha-beta hydrolase superfamily lysophospholipase [Paractinoplanes brasiliensis]|uniref:Alpha-beta hydrolase superfamily lysophospholipase n=1 Tax=Paractinoplanes brasiliensis TaxID=52695 RepID=A0A4R6JAU9_9ACTN|nr:alpha-beta hydrolase superfamily lysophospholipase [Actinoplanes brasiliensis]GID30975.1 lipase [Actinoplanes brasiliensis]